MDSVIKNKHELHKASSRSRTQWCWENTFFKHHCPKGHWAKLHSIVSKCHPDTFSFSINLIPTVSFGLMIHCSCLGIATHTHTYTTMQLLCQFHIIQNAILNTPSRNNQDPIHEQLKPPKPPKCPNPSSKTSCIKHISTSSFAIQIEAIHLRSLSSKAPKTKNESLQKLDMKWRQDIPQDSSGGYMSGGSFLRSGDLHERDQARTRTTQ